MSLTVRQWLSSINLEQYLGQFTDRGITTAIQCSVLQESDLVDLGVNLPGHRRRILTHLPDVDGDIYENITASQPPVSGDGSLPSGDTPPKLPVKTRTSDPITSLSQTPNNGKSVSGKRPVPRPRKSSKKVPDVGVMTVPAVQMPTIEDDVSGSISVVPSESSEGPPHETMDKSSACAVLSSSGTDEMTNVAASKLMPVPSVKPRQKARPIPSPRKGDHSPAEKSFSGSGSTCSSDPDLTAGHMNTSCDIKEHSLNKETPVGSLQTTLSYENLFSELSLLEKELDASKTQPLSSHTVLSSESSDQLPVVNSVVEDVPLTETKESENSDLSIVTAETDLPVLSDDTSVIPSAQRDSVPVEQSDAVNLDTLTSFDDSLFDKMENNRTVEEDKSASLTDSVLVGAPSVADRISRLSLGSQRDSRSSVDSISKLYTKVNKAPSAGETEWVASTGTDSSTSRSSLASNPEESLYESIWEASGKVSSKQSLEEAIDNRPLVEPTLRKDLAPKSAIPESVTEPLRLSFAGFDPFITHTAGISVYGSDVDSAFLEKSETVDSKLLSLDEFDPLSKNPLPSPESIISFDLPEPNFSPPPLPGDDGIQMPDFAPPPVPSPTCPDAPAPPIPMPSPCPQHPPPPPPVPARIIDARPSSEPITTPKDIITHQPLLSHDPFADFWPSPNTPPNELGNDNTYDTPPPSYPPPRPSPASLDDYDTPPHPTSNDRSLFEKHGDITRTMAEPSFVNKHVVTPAETPDFMRLSEIVPLTGQFAAKSNVLQDPWGCADQLPPRPTRKAPSPPPPLPPPRDAIPFESFNDDQTSLYCFESDDWKGSTPQLDTSCGASEGSLSDGGEFLSIDSLTSPTTLINMGCVDKADINSRIPVIPHVPKSMEKSGYLFKHAGKQDHKRLLKKKWVTFNNGCLRYYKNNKHRISDRIIPVSTMKNVENDIRTKDFRFKLTTVDRVYIFSSDDRDSILQWTSTLMQAILSYKPPAEGFKYGGDMCNPDKEGYIGIGNEKGKRYFVVKNAKVCYYNSYDDYKVATPIHEIEMNLASVKEQFGKNKIQLSTPYRHYMLSFDSAQEVGQWMSAFREAITEGLSDDTVMNRLYENPSNRVCADCGQENPDWAATHLLVVICKKCAGIHRELWPFKVKSLRMDLKVWKPTLIELYVTYGNEAANSLWEYSLAIGDNIQSDCDMSRRKDFIVDKYCKKSFLKHHLLSGDHLNEALCRAVQYPDVLETMEALFSGANILAASEVEQGLTPLQLAERAGLPLQVELLNQNGGDTSTGTQQPLSHSYQNISSLVKPVDISKKGWMHKTGSNRKEFLRRWCTLEHKVLSYYLDDKSTSPKDSIQASEMITITQTSNERFRFCFELSTLKDSGRVYLFALEDHDDRLAWTMAIAKSFCPDGAVDYIKKSFDRAGYVYIKEGLNAKWIKSWIQLHMESRMLYMFDEGTCEFEEIDLRKVTKIQAVDSVDQGHVFVVYLPGRWLYIQADLQKETESWLNDLNTVATSTSQSLSDQQLTAENIPVLVDKCINFIYTHGMTIEGIYRHNGQHSKVTALLQAFAQDARAVVLKLEDYGVHDVANSLKRFFRQGLTDPLLTKELYSQWLDTAGMVDHDVKMRWYKHLVDKLPEVNKCTLKKLILHLKNISDQNSENKMTIVNLASIFGPALMTLDCDQDAARSTGFDTTKYEITTIVDMIQYNTWLFEVEDAELDKERKIQEALEKMKNAQSQKVQAGEFIMGVYMNDRQGKCLNIKVPGYMTAEELVLQVSASEEFNPNRYAVFEVICQGELERPLNDHEKVLDVTLSWSSWDEEFRKENYLCIKHNYVQLKVDTVISPHLSSFSELKFSNKKNFKKFFFQFSQSKLSYFKDSKLETPEASWNAEDIVLFMGVEKRRAPPKDYPFAFTFILRHEHVIRNKESPYFGRTVCCGSDEELYRWVAAILTAQRSTRASCYSTASFDYSFKEAPSGLASVSKKGMFKKFNKLSFKR